MIFQKIQSDKFEQVLFCQDSQVGLKAIIALHSLALGPATGGCRFWNYSTEEEALHDVLRLSKGMSYKASLAGLNWGGGKAVILGDTQKTKTPEMLHRFGEFVERLKGHYITAKDVGISADDLREIKKKTQHVLGIEGDAGSSGDPSPATAWGVFFGMRACTQFAFQTNRLKGLKIALQGLGSVSYYLLEHLIAEGAEVIGCDIDPLAVERAVKKYGIEIVSSERIYDVDCDLFAPAALGGAINQDTLGRLKCKVIAGPANNQLESPEIGYEIMSRGIVYAPDYAINAGGLINIYYEEPRQGGFNRVQALEHVSQIEKTMTHLLERAREDQLPTHVVADRMAEERIQKALRTQLS